MIYFLYTAADAPRAWEENPQFLETAKIVEAAPMGKGTNDVYNISFENGKRCVFKKCNEDMAESLAELAAYRASGILGFPNVPTTVLREVKELGLGTLQPCIEATAISNDEELVQTARKQYPDEWANFDIFNFVFGQWDSGPENFFIVDGRPVAFDNGALSSISFVGKYAKGVLPFYSFTFPDSSETPFLFETADDVEINGKWRTVINYKDLQWTQAWQDNFTNYCPQTTLEKLTSLNKEMLRNDIFLDSQRYSAQGGERLLSDQYLDQILSRRDMVAKYFR